MILFEQPLIMIQTNKLTQHGLISLLHAAICHNNDILLLYGRKSQGNGGNYGNAERVN